MEKTFERAVARNGRRIFKRETKPDNVPDTLEKYGRGEVRFSVLEGQRNLFCQALCESAGPARCRRPHETKGSFHRWRFLAWLAVCQQKSKAHAPLLAE